MRMLHFKQSGLVTVSAMHEGVCVWVGMFELSVCDLPGLLSNLVNVNQTAFFLFVHLCVIVIDVAFVSK